MSAMTKGEKDHGAPLTVASAIGLIATIALLHKAPDFCFQEFPGGLWSGSVRCTETSC